MQGIAPFACGGVAVEPPIAMKSDEPTYWTMSENNQVLDPHTMLGLGHKRMRDRITNVVNFIPDSNSLADRVRETTSQKHLNRLLSAQ